MDQATHRGEVREFLATRRGRLQPDQAGVQSVGRRRVPGLRREEVARLAGVSVEYYTRLEKGNLSGVSDTVLDAVAGALQFDDVERSHLFDLARTANTPRTRPPRERHSPTAVKTSIQWLLDSLTMAAAFVRNGRLDILAVNPLARVLYAQALDDRHPNLARFVFLDPRATTFYRDWDGIADDAVGSLRVAAGREPRDRALTALVDELATRSEPFRLRWATHDVRAYRRGRQRFHHPAVGDLELAFDVLTVVADPQQMIVAYTAQPGSAAARQLMQLAASSS